MTDMNRYLAALPEELQRRQFAHLDLEDQDLLVDYLKHMRKHDPLTLNQSHPHFVAQMNLLRGGTTDELSIWLCKEIGAFPYTDVPAKWSRFREMYGQEEDPTWTDLTEAFQTVEFKFLNEVSPEFAERMRAEGRLESLRSYLRDVWKASKKPDDKKPSEDDIRTFKDRLTHEFNEARAEYEAIDSDLIAWLGGGTMMGAFQGAFVPGTYSPVWPAGGFAVGALSKLWKSFRDRRAFSRKVPMSVFIDLQRGKRK